MDWKDCPDVESKPNVMSGVPVVRGTRVPAVSILEHVADGYTPEEIVTEIFPSVPLARVERIIAFSRRNIASPA